MSELKRGKKEAIPILVQEFLDIKIVGHLLKLSRQSIRRYMKDHTAGYHYKHYAFPFYSVDSINTPYNPKLKLNTIPFRYRAYIVLLENGFSYQEISEIFNIKFSTLKREIRRYRKSIQQSTN